MCIRDRDHDIAYAASKNIEDRLKVDKVLENQAWDRVKSKDAAFFGEKIPAYITTNLIKAKRMFDAGMKVKRRRTKSHKKINRMIGAGLRSKKNEKRKRRGKLSFSQVLRAAKQEINPNQSLSDNTCLLYTSPSPRDRTRSRMPSSA